MKRPSHWQTIGKRFFGPSRLRISDSRWPARASLARGCLVDGTGDEGAVRARADDVIIQADTHAGVRTRAVRIDETTLCGRRRASTTVFTQRSSVRDHEAAGVDTKADRVDRGGGSRSCCVPSFVPGQRIALATRSTINAIAPTSSAAPAAFMPLRMGSRFFSKPKSDPARNATSTPTDTSDFISSVLIFVRSSFGGWPNTPWRTRPSAMFAPFYARQKLRFRLTASRLLSRLAW